MKQYTITKVVYANSLSEAGAREKDGIVVNINLNDELKQDEYNDYITRKKYVQRGIKN